NLSGGIDSAAQRRPGVNPGNGAVTTIGFSGFESAQRRPGVNPGNGSSVATTGASAPSAQRRPGVNPGNGTWRLQPERKGPRRSRSAGGEPRQRPCWTQSVITRPASLRRVETKASRAARNTANLAFALWSCQGSPAVRASEDPGLPKVSSLLHPQGVPGI